MMKTIVTLGLVGAIAALGGCGAPTGVPGMELVEAEGYTLPTSASAACAFPGTIAQSAGTMDIGPYTNAVPTDAFSWPFLVENHLKFDSTTSPTATTTYDFQGQKMVASYLGTNDATTTALSGLHAEVPGAYTVREGSHSDIVAELIPPNVGQAIASALSIPAGGSKTVLVRFHFSGVLQNGRAVSTNDLQFPVRVCSGCLNLDKVSAACTAAKGILVACGGGIGQVPMACITGK